MTRPRAVLQFPMHIQKQQRHAVHDAFAGVHRLMQFVRAVDGVVDVQGYGA